MPPSPQSLHSSTVNPANLLELQVLTQVATQLQCNNDIRGSIPYLAKIAQIVDNQKLARPAREEPQDNYYAQLNQLRKVKADAYAQLADAYFKTQQFVLCESSLLSSVKIWEKLVQHTNEDLSVQLKAGYKQLKACYEAMGKTQLARHMETKLSKLVSVV
jgi:hypothetical protein